MTDTPETLQAALKDLEARVAAFEQAQKRAEEEEPPVCSETLLRYLEDGNTNLCGVDYQKAAREIRYLRRELARLKEGLKRQEGELSDHVLSDYTDNPERVPVFGAVTYRSECVRMAREIQRHRALVKP